MVSGKAYTIYGYKGKQVRDNIHSEDLVEMFWEYHQNPRPGEVYNAGGGRANSVSIVEAIDKVNKLLVENGKPAWDSYELDSTARQGDHVWYITSLEKFKQHYPNWKIKNTLEDIIKQITTHELQFS